MIVQFMKWTAFILVVLLAVAVISLLAQKTYLKYSTKITTSNGVSSLEEITLGGLKQWIFIRCEDQKKPILLFLHGGPGAPILGMSSSRKYDAELIKYFIVVHWDQRGAGKSYDSGIAVNTMTFDQLVADCNELIDYLRNRFNTQKVFVVGHSGGSVIGIKTAFKYPEKLYAYIGIGQIVNDYEQQKISYDFIVDEALKSGNVTMQRAIRELGPPPYDTPKVLNKKDGYIFRYGGVIHNNSIWQLASLILAFLTTPEYSLPEGFLTLMNKGYTFTTAAMWDELRKVNISEEIQLIDVPVYFFEGKYDMATPTVLVEDYYDKLDAVKGKNLIVFENSAHLPLIEEKAKYDDLLINVVLKETMNATLNMHYESQ